MATNFLTQLTEIYFDAGFVEATEVGIQALPVYAPSFDWFKNENITNTGLKGRARNDTDITGASWMEGTFAFDMCGINTYDDGGTKYENPYWGVVCQSAGMSKTGVVGVSSYVYEVEDDIHLDSDLVHTSGNVVPLTGAISIDGMYHPFENLVSDITFSVDVTAGPPRLTVNTGMGNIYDDQASPDEGQFPYPATDLPQDLDPGSGTFEAPSAVDSRNATLSISILPTNGGEAEIIVGTCLRNWSHTLGNNIGEQRCISEEFKLDQFIITDQNANSATLVIRAADPGVIGTPSSFNPENVRANHDMLRLSITHNDGVAQGEIQFEADYYIQTVAKAPDSAGVLEYTLTMQQANVIPAGTAAQYLKVTVT